MKRLPPPLLALTPGQLVDDVDELGGRASGASKASEASKNARELIARVTAALDAGLRGVLVREPGLGDARTLELCALISEVISRRAPGTWLGLHDRVHLAAAARVDGVHVGFRSLAPREARALLPPDVALGWSTHADDFALDPAAQDGARADPLLGTDTDYAFHGPVHATPSKSALPPGVDPGDPIGTTGLRRAVQRTRVPLWALGGLGPEDVGPVLATGARGLAVLGGLLGSPQPAERARLYLTELARSMTPSAADRDSERES